ncbi:pyruvate-flavodoxin oxidoreductase [Klebsiella pneumoniae]|nr:pyruvate-flavodoxin oxidoreductase [Klebsiella pneumoniae]
MVSVLRTKSTKSPRWRDDTIRALLPQDKIAEHRQRALNPEHPVNPRNLGQPRHFISSPGRPPIRGYDAVYDHVEKAMDDFAAGTGRQYKPFEFYGHPQAERVIVIMGSAIGTCEEVVDELLSRGEKVGVAKSPPLSPVLPPPTCWRRCRRAPARLPYWIAPKNPARLPNRFTST